MIADRSVRQLADARARSDALDPSRSFIVQAPAGSGKTELLIQRYLVLLGRVEKPEEILAVTFTRKAAAEMRKRILHEATREDIAHRLRIMTIDALCASLTRQMPVLARFGAQPEIVEDAGELYREAAFRLLQDLSPAVEKLLAHLDNNVETATGLLAGMLAKRDQWLRKTGAAPGRAELEAALAFERKRRLDQARSLDPRACEDFAREVLTREGAWRKRPKQAQALAGNEPLREALTALLALPPAAYSETQWQALAAILDLLKPAVQQLKVLFGERGQADFTEIAHGALLALGSPEEPTDLLLALDSRIAHILVDEFQDTSISQWELIERLTAGWEEGDGRTVFAVGDPMQSIYRFREAEVGLFLHARHAGIGNVRLEPLTLSTNFRSQERLVEWFNRVFPQVLPSRPDETSGAVPYSAATPHPEHPAVPGEAAAWHCFYDRISEASRVIRILREEKGKSAILVRNRIHLDEIVPALKEAGIRYRAVEIEQLGEKQVVQDLYALTRALAHLADRVAWLAILRAPWCGLSLQDLSQLFEGKQELTVWELMQDVPALCRIRSILAPAIANRLRGTLRERVEGAWLALGGPACVEDATDLEDAGIFLDELERLEQAGDLEDMAVLAASLESLYALPDVAAGPEAVEIMTIHKAKGLEFDTVIVPGLDRGPGRGRKPLFAWKTLPDAKLLLAPIDETGGAGEPLYRYVRDLDREAEDIEAGRLLYVAATRARQRLHLLACATPGDDGAPEPPAKRSLLNKIWFDAAARFGAAPAQAAAPSPSAQKPADALRRLPSDFTPPAPPDPARWTAPPEGRDEEQIEFSWAGETARHVGTVVHRWLHRIADDELRGWDAKRVDSLRSGIARDLERRGVRPPELESAADLVSTALKNTLTDERGRWILGPHADARSEHRIRTRARSFVIDRLVRDDQGMLWVVDYKTSRHEGADLEAFLDAERKRYAAQLDAYAVALGGARRGLYFPLHSGWRAWSP